MSVTKLGINYISPLILLLFVFIIISSFFWIAAPQANAGAFLCTDLSCQSEEACLSLVFCCVGGGDECPKCFWTGSACLNSPPPIPTLNQWGTIIMAGVLGLFAVVGIFAMRRRSSVKS
jgi:hypothetical protein